MELSVREWMIIIGVLLIVAVLLDGYRRVRNERRNRIRVSLSKQVFSQNSAAGAEAAAGNPELPNGGARVKVKRSPPNLQLDEPVPVLMQSVRMGEPEPEDEPEPLDARAEQAWVDDRFEEAEEAEPQTQDERYDVRDDEPEADADWQATPSQDDDWQDAPRRDESRWDEPLRDEPVREQPRREMPRHAAELADDEEFFGEPMAAAEPNSQAPNIGAAQEVMVIHVISKDEQGFRGQDLLQILLACDLRFGRMNIFHRFEQANGRGPVQFSLANLVEPGSFDLDAMDGVNTPGVTLFLALPGPEKPITAFNYMVETAQVLVRNLNGELRDEAHSVMTAQTIEHCRQRIRDFERRQLTLQI